MTGLILSQNVDGCSKRLTHRNAFTWLNITKSMTDLWMYNVLRTHIFLLLWKGVYSYFFRIWGGNIYISSEITNNVYQSLCLNKHVDLDTKYMHHSIPIREQNELVSFYLILKFTYNSLQTSFKGYLWLMLFYPGVWIIYIEVARIEVCLFSMCEKDPETFGKYLFCSIKILWRL